VRAPSRNPTINHKHSKYQQPKYHYNMIIVQVKDGESIEKALKKFKRKFEKTGIVRELRSRQAFEKPSVTNRKKMMKAVYVQQLRANEE
jgi:small subunit ribosomal protein S21